MHEEQSEPFFNEQYNGYQKALDAAADTTHPMDILEPLPEDTVSFKAGYRAAGKQFIFHINSIVSFLLESDNKQASIYAVGFAYGAAAVGKSMADAAENELGCTRAAISKQVKAYCRSNNINADFNPYMKSDKATAAYRESRIGSIHTNNLTKGVTVCQKKAKK